MAYGFYAYIDEAGDQGFTFLDPPDRASSQWFVISAVVVPERIRNSEMRAYAEFAKSITKKHWSKLHFQTLPHERRAAITHYLSQRRIRVISVCWNKREITEDNRDHTLHYRTRLYHYAIRYLLERISWMCRDHAKRPDETTCRLIFAKCKNLKYDVIQGYLQHLQRGTDNSVNIHWPAIDSANLVVKPSSELLGLQMSDAVASGVYRGLELGPLQRSEPTYVRHLRNITYCRNGNFLTYGLKIMPRLPEVEPQFDNRYDWLAEYQ